MHDDLNRTISALYLDGMGLPGIARTLGRSMCFVSGRLKKAGVPLRKPGNPKKDRPERRVPEVDINEAVQRYLDGATATAIAADGKISRTTLVKALRDRGIEIRVQATGDDREIIAAYLSGKSVNQIEQEIGCTKRRASNVLKKAGIKFRERTRQKTPPSRSWACKKRAESIARATPSWADRDQIKAIYAECRSISRATGKKHHVDHFYPLHGELVSGLHVPANLRIISERENVAKKNRVCEQSLEWKYAS